MKNKIGYIFDKYWKGVVSITFFLAIWEISVPDGSMRKFFISRPSLIFQNGVDLINSGFLWPHVVTSLQNLLIGIFCAAVVGVFLSLFIGTQKKMYGFFEPYIYVLSTVPKVAFLPLIILWVGVGVYSKILIVFISALIPILINALQGIESVRKEYLSMARSFGASKFQIIKHVIFFDMLPFLFSGLKIAIGRGVSGLIVAEAFGVGSGLGYLVSFYGLTFQSGKLMFIIFLLFLMVMILKNIIGEIQKHMLRYKR
ncbi:MAG: hypothetical protein ACD_9C00318G0001 [uncultured bacterium]|nr:MAG: hypothetical protein ACD_9C00318G0001 [uncultured bacterium]